MCRTLILVNPLLHPRKSRELPRILRVFKEAGVTVEVAETQANRRAGEQARQAIAAGVECIVVCGGDGTVFDVLQGMAGSKASLGIIPFGTGNILAQNLRIPKDPAAAAQWLLSAKPKDIPLGRISFCGGNGRESWYFAMSAGMGVHAAMMTAAQRAKKDWSGRAAYFMAGLQLLFQHSLEPFDVEVTGTSGQMFQRRVCEAIAVRVSELNIWRPGGGFEFPFLRLATVETGPGQNGSRWQLARATYQGLFRAAGERERPQSAGAPARYEDATRLVCRRIEGFPYQVPLAVQADGEVLDASCALIEMAGVSVQMLAGGRQIAAARYAQSLSL
jgi:diacylglycerol kinase family enzyme